MTGVTAGQAAHAAACWQEGIDDAAEVAALWQGLDDSELRYWKAVTAAVIAAQQPQAAGCPASSRLPVVAGEPDGHLDACDLAEGHTGDHHCPECGTRWIMLSDHLASKQPQPAPELGTAWRLLDEARAELAGLRDEVRQLRDLGRELFLMARSEDPTPSSRRRLDAIAKHFGLAQ